jgi:hypothetical protein
MATDIGSRLQQAREARGQSLRDVAETTKISMFCLRAIEANDFGRLPGGIFRRAYVRSFAETVGLDAGEVVGDYQTCFEPNGVSPFKNAPGAGRVSTALRVVALVVAGVGILLWTLFVSQGSA